MGGSVMTMIALSDIQDGGAQMRVEMPDPARPLPRLAEAIGGAA